MDQDVGERVCSRQIHPTLKNNLEFTVLDVYFLHESLVGQVPVYRTLRTLVENV